MNKMKLHAHLIDIGVVDENDVVVIKDSPSVYPSHYITIISGLNSVASYNYQNNELVIVEGEAHISDILKMKDLNMEDFE